MKTGPLGVWFSIALAILALGFWLGSMLGSRVAVHWYKHLEFEHGTLGGPARTHAESQLTDLAAIQTLETYALVAQNKKELWGKSLDNEIKGLEEIKRRSTTQEIEPVINFYLGIAYVDAAIEEEQNNQEEATKHDMQSAQALFKGLGWQDCSEETLKATARQELDRWRLKPN